MTLEELVTRWMDAARAKAPDKDEWLEKARTRASKEVEADMVWAAGAMVDPRLRYAAAFLFYFQKTPPALVPSYLTALREEGNPSTVKLFVRPLLESLGHARLLELLAEMLPERPPEEQGNIARSLYWMGFTVAIPQQVLASDQPVGPGEWAQIVREGISPDPRSVKSAWERMHEVMLDAYLRSDDSLMRIMIGMHMSLDPSDHPPRLRPKVLRVREICLADPELREHSRL